MSDIVLLDGSIGQELVNRLGDSPTKFWSTSVMLEHPGLVTEVHNDYFQAGATIATTNTYSVLSDRLKGTDLEGSLHQLWDTAVNAATDARNIKGVGRVAGSIGPLFASYRPDICPSASSAEKIYQEVTNILASKTDLLLIETMSSIDQAEGAIRAAVKTDVPVWLSFTVDDFDGTKLRSGESLCNAKHLVDTYKPEAVLINCSRPEAVTKAVEIISDFGVQFGAYANGFEEINNEFLEDSPTVAVLDKRSDLIPKTYAEFGMTWINMGATIVGGCCEVGPTHIRELAQKIITAGHKIV
jgi:homocysteine S-methyltransferase